MSGARSLSFSLLCLSLSLLFSSLLLYTNIDRSRYFPRGGGGRFWYAASGGEGYEEEEEQQRRRRREGTYSLRSLVFLDYCCVHWCGRQGPSALLSVLNRVAVKLLWLL